LKIQIQVRCHVSSTEEFEADSLEEAHLRAAGWGRNHLVDDGEMSDLSTFLSGSAGEARRHALFDPDAAIKLKEAITHAAQGFDRFAMPVELIARCPYCNCPEDVPNYKVGDTVKCSVCDYVWTPPS
jgi:hypothetical protein